MVSKFQYATVTELEAFAVKDYSAVSARYTNTAIEGQISQAEYIINGRTHTTYGSGVATPDLVVAATLEIAKRLMHNIMVEDGAMPERVNVIDPYVIEIIDMILEPEIEPHDFKLVTGVTDRYWNL